MDEYIVAVKYMDETIREYDGIPLTEVGIGDLVDGYAVARIYVEFPEGRSPKVTFAHQGGTATVLPDVRLISYITRTMMPGEFGEAIYLPE